MAHIVVMQRPNETLTMPADLEQWYQQYLANEESQYKLAGSIIPVTVTQLAISASQIRNQLAEGESPQFLLPDAVISLIEMLGLYQSK